MILVGKNHEGMLKMSLEVSPCHSCPGGLPQACPSLHFLPWHQPYLAPPATLGYSPHHSPPEETRNRFHAREVGMAKIGRKVTGLGVTLPQSACVTLNLHHYPLQQSLGVAAGVHWGSAGRGRGLHVIFYVSFLPK